MAQIITVDCEECEGKSVIKIPSKYEDDYQVVACPLCGAPWDGHEDLNLEDE